MSQPKPHGADRINAKEIRSALNEARRMAADYPGSRFVELLDSRVAIGVCAKGRSASKLLKHELLRAVPDFIACDAHLGVSLRADAIAASRWAVPRQFGSAQTHRCMPTLGLGAGVGRFRPL